MILLYIDMGSFKTKLILITLMVLMVLDTTYAPRKYNIIITFIILFLNICNIHQVY